MAVTPETSSGADSRPPDDASQRMELMIIRWLNEEEHKDSELDMAASMNPAIGSVINAFRERGEQTSTIVAGEAPTIQHIEHGEADLVQRDVSTRNRQRRNRKKAPRSTEEVIANYPPVENETLVALKRCKSNMQAAIKRFQQRQNIETAGGESATPIPNSTRAVCVLSEITAAEPVPVANAGVKEQSVDTNVMFAELSVADGMSGQVQLTMTASQQRRNRARLQKAARRAQMTESQKESVRARDAAAKANKTREQVGVESAEQREKRLRRHRDHQRQSRANRGELQRVEDRHRETLNRMRYGARTHDSKTLGIPHLMNSERPMQWLA